MVNNGHPEDKYGWALAGGAKFNLPGGDMIGFNVCYAEGAPGFCTNNAVFTALQLQHQRGRGLDRRRRLRQRHPNRADQVWSALAGYEHIWNPKWRTSFFGGYVNVNYNGTATDLINAAPPWQVRRREAAAPRSRTAYHVQRVGNSCSPDYGFWEAGTRTQWNPVPQLDIGLEVLYTQPTPPTKARRPPANGSRPAVVNAVIDDQDVWSAMFRWQRNFYP